ncbi:unknown [Antheraea pernyi nucleopolyhedrovirus]|uniref:Ac78 n=2 Tax=Antheraea pernyi nuclear polyhedrosis virus TaxID=161494 RepID=Q1HH23_NPVAP|nr:hypothetical protein APNV_p075 [Antheraea pernyi nucleopolyhedrovirus]AFY62880.1 hypothetical protein [Philosamia cynthia ricini nucleopolyhedrovirus virus]AWD33595.1 hypothetical protein [Antheraea proylei nucleopolyhedrovirus]BBD50532.1 hypothetical protein [Antheraea yamamai nucleopolyhedrovirus]BBD50684.1 hypothetical protein [Samia cynthia nucleopolyhedrovirus]BBD51140.1 hypothetical protein [Samia ricini nucleopolyhedrovirus]
MNLEVPYYRLGSHERVEYIPLKLALNDEAPAADAAAYDYGEASKADAPANQAPVGLIVLISLVAFVALFLLLYVIYYFLILRERPQYSDDAENDPAFVFNKFD